MFAPRGGGKSALRVILASQAAPASPEATTLAVEYTDFDVLITKQRSRQEVVVEDHVSRLLRAGAKALLDSFCGDSGTRSLGVEDDIGRQRRARRAASVPAPSRSRLAALLRTYHSDLIGPEALYERLQALDPSFSPAWSDFLAAVTGRRLRELIAGSPLCADEIAGFLVDLSDYPITPVDSAATPTEQMASFAGLARAVELDAVWFLVDRLDEVEETADDPEAQADILEPLLAHLPVLETPGVAFKFFLSREARDVLIDRSIRLDRLTDDQAVTVTWDRERLKHMLDERLAVYSGEQVHDLTQLCRETRVHVGRERIAVPLGEWIEGEMLQLAEGSPRRLLVAAQLLCQAHVKRCGPSGLVEEVDWKRAKAGLMRRMPPLLRLLRDSRIVLVGDREVGLTSQQHAILLTLAEAHGQCDRETLADEVWGTTEGVSDAAIDQAIRRLRQKLGDDPNRPTYIKTIRDSGFVLLHCEVG